ncbi:hypothetical protein [Pectobacterium parmentieri]|uniref:transcriptional antitermination N peptide n=1 Tax=Pectobacterium parmentieri TaxID=1905730 RepID=UPI000EAC5EEC|nr:hypothetical protein [Pectobacterium parmentieri]QQA77034.1 hypothetical protein JBL47_05375 [Pectobacterium parmentieri]RKO74386.1 hypothetical protein C5E04_18890 [Pectobacterium parmentieri]
MTTIIVKPVKDNAKRRKYLKTGAFFAQKDADRELAQKISKAWAKLTRVELPKRSEPEYSGSCCLPQVALYSAGHRGKTKSIYQAR